jgi:hypothetical protein
VRPALKVRNSTIKGNFIDTLNLVPVFSYGPVGVIYDDAFFPGCPYAWAIKTYYERRNDTFAGYYEEIILPVKDSLQKAFNYSDEFMTNFTAVQAGTCNDILVAEDFEGDKPRYRFSAVDRYHIWYI